MARQIILNGYQLPIEIIEKSKTIQNLVTDCSDEKIEVNWPISKPVDSILSLLTDLKETGDSDLLIEAISLFSYLDLRPKLDLHWSLFRVLFNDQEDLADKFKRLESLSKDDLIKLVRYLELDEPTIKLLILLFDCSTEANLFKMLGGKEWSSYRTVNWTILEKFENHKKNIQCYVSEYLSKPKAWIDHTETQIYYLDQNNLVRKLDTDELFSSIKFRKIFGLKSALLLEGFDDKLYLFINSSIKKLMDLTDGLTVTHVYSYVSINKVISQIIMNDSNGHNYLYEINDYNYRLGLTVKPNLILANQIKNLQITKIDANVAGISILYKKDLKIYAMTLEIKRGEAKFIEDEEYKFGNLIFSVNHESTEQLIAYQNGELISQNERHRSHIKADPIKMVHSGREMLRVAIWTSDNEIHNLHGYFWGVLKEKQQIVNLNMSNSIVYHEML